jgi:hypothetical protein
MTNVVSAVSSEKAVAAMSGAVGIQLAAPVLGKIPGIGSPMGRVVAGAVIAFIAVRYLDGYAEAAVLGIGAGLVAQGAAAMLFKVESVSA